MKVNGTVDTRVLWGLGLTKLSVVAGVAWLNPGLVSFRAFSAAEFIQQMLPLLMVALFIERVLEVFLESWRAHRTARLRARAEHARKTHPAGRPQHADEIAYAEHQARTRRIALFAGTTLGVTVAALGMRVLEMFADPTALASLPLLHQRLFRTVDVLMTGAVLGGGSDALHQLVLVFTNFFQSAARRVKGDASGRA